MIWASTIVSGQHFVEQVPVNLPRVLAYVTRNRRDHTEYSVRAHSGNARSGPKCAKNFAMATSLDSQSALSSGAKPITSSSVVRMCDKSYLRRN